MTFLTSIGTFISSAFNYLIKNPLLLIILILGLGFSYLVWQNHRLAEEVRQTKIEWAEERERSIALADSLKIYIAENGQTVGGVLRIPDEDQVDDLAGDYIGDIVDDYGGDIVNSTRVTFDPDSETVIEDGLIPDINNNLINWAIRDTVANSLVSLDLQTSSPEYFLSYTMNVDPLPYTITLAEVIRGIDPENPELYGTEILVEAPGTLIDVQSYGDRGTNRDPIRTTRTDYSDLALTVRGVWPIGADNSLTADIAVGAELDLAAGKVLDTVPVRLQAKANHYIMNDITTIEAGIKIPIW